MNQDPRQPNTTTTAASPAKGPNLWPVSIIAFFGLAILALGGFVAFCSLHPAELVAPDYYEKELRHQQTIDATERARGIHASVTFDDRRWITVSVPGLVSGGLSNAIIQFYRPSGAGLDHQLPFRPDGNGEQRVDAGHLTPGLWKVRVSWTADRKDYFVEAKVVIPAAAGSGGSVQSPNAGRASEVAAAGNTGGVRD
jgi:nitrogen fixation protein FixH